MNDFNPFLYANFVHLTDHRKGKSNEIETTSRPYQHTHNLFIIIFFRSKNVIPLIGITDDKVKYIVYVGTTYIYII